MKRKKKLGHEMTHFPFPKLVRALHQDQRKRGGLPKSDYQGTDCSRNPLGLHVHERRREKEAR